MNGHRSIRELAELTGEKPTSHVTDLRVGKEDDPLPEGSEYASDRCGIENTRQAQQGFVLIETVTDTPLAIMYTAIQNTIRWLLPCTLEFQFEDDRGMWQVHIVGNDTEAGRKAMKLLQMRLIGGKRELLHCGSKEIIREIRVMEVKEEESGE